MPNRWPRPTKPLAAALVTLCLGPLAGAQDICAEPAEILLVRMGGQERGEWLARFSRQSPQVWIEPPALLSGEAGYIASRISCGDNDFVALRPELVWQKDGSLGTLNLEPNLALLPTVRRELENLTRPLSGDLPVLSTAVQGQASGTGLDSFNVAVSATPSYVVGKTTLGGLVAVSASNETVNLSSQLSAEVRPSRNLALGATLTPGQLTLYAEPNSRHTRGPTAAVWLNAGRQTARLLPPVRVEVPLGGLVMVRVPGSTFAPLQVEPGTLVLGGISLPDHGGEVVIEVQDGRGHHRQREVFAAANQALNSGDWQLNVRADASAQRQSLYLSGALGLASTWRLAGQATVSPEAALLSVDALYHDGPQHWQLMAQAASSAGTWNSRFGVSYQYAVQHWQLGLRSQWSSLPEERSLGVTLGVRQTRWSLYGSAIWLGGQPALSVSANVRLNAQLALSGSGNWNAQQQNWRLDLRWQPSSALAVQASLSDAPEAQVNYRVNDDLTLGVQANRERIAVSATGGVSAHYLAQLDTGGHWSANIRSVYAATPATQGWSASSQLGVVILNVGLPDLPVRLNNVPAGRTDIHGRLLLTGVHGGTRQTVSVNVDELPIEVQVVNDQLSFTVEGQTAVEVDWSDNFIRLVPVNFRYAGQPAHFGSVVIEGNEYPLDELGRVFLPPRFIEGILKVNGQQCPVQWRAPQLVGECNADNKSESVFIKGQARWQA